MRRRLTRAYGFFLMFGVDPLKAFHSIRGLPAFFRDLRQLKRQRKNASEDFQLGELFPCLGDRFTDSGSVKGHYFHQDLLVARRINLNNPRHHVDVGSRIDGFVAHVASFRAVEVIDIRPLPNNVQNITFKKTDFMKPLRDDLIEYCDSVSSLHAIEHFGLGRYGDPVNFQGYRLGLENLFQMLRTGGKLYFSVPIGPQRIEFNAHRVFSIGYLLECFKGKYHLDQFSFVDDQGNLHENVSLSDDEVQKNFGCLYGCGIFELTKQ